MIYFIIGCVGFTLSIFLIIGISHRDVTKVHPWIIIQVFNIGYQLYFTFEFVQTTFLEASSVNSYSSLIITMVLIFHIVFEGYYLCFIIGISQFIANYRFIEKTRCDHETENLKIIPNPLGDPKLNV